MRPGTDQIKPSVGSAAVLLLGLLAACSGQPVERLPESVYALPSSYYIDGLPFYPQVEDQCGPASLATMLAARGVSVDPESLREKLYIPARGGALATEMTAQARRYGLLVYPLEPELDKILAEVAGGNPVLVLQNLGFDWMPRWHFSVVIGFDRGPDNVVLRSGYEPALEVPFELFMKTWSRADRWAVAIVRPDHLPATAHEGGFVKAASELEQVGELDAALAAYLTAVATWPAADTALFGAANTAYATERYTQAVDLFTAFVKRQPSSAAGWNNLAYSFTRLGCDAQALEAVSCAVNLDPGNPVYSESRRELYSSADPGITGRCEVPMCPDDKGAEPHVKKQR